MYNKCTMIIAKVFALKRVRLTGSLIIDTMSVKSVLFALSV